MNRNSCAKYLDILNVNGQIDLKEIGRAKVYHLSHRVPISALLNFSSDLIIIIDRKLGIVEVNNNLLKLFKFKKEILMDTKLTNTSIPIFNDKDHLKLLRSAIIGKGSRFETKIEFEEGVKYFLVRLIPSTFGDGDNGVTIIMENNTEQKLAQMKLKESEEKFRALFDSSPDAILMMRDGKFIYCNPSSIT